jgi:hypothetical protein
LAKLRREDIRWQILLTLNNARPIGCYEQIPLSVVRSTYPDASPLEIRKEMGYLESRNLVEIKKQPDGRWLCEISRFGVDVAEYTVDVEPGIARPEKYF